MKPREVMLMVAPNGARKSKADHPALPLSAEELAAQAAACLDAGAAVLHLHVRDAHGGHSLDARLYHEAMRAIGAATRGRMIVQMTTEAVGRYSAKEQMRAVRAVVPAAVSLALRELVPNDADNRLGKARGFFRWLKVMTISPQFILYDPADVRRFLNLREKGIIPFRKPFLLMVLGRHAADGESAPEELDPFLEALGDAPAHWAVCAFGRREAEIAVHAARKGGHARIGFENNTRLPDGTQAPDNAALVEATARMLREAGFGIMPPEAAKTVFRNAAA